MAALTLARRGHARLPDTNALEAVESELELLGLIALIDPPRPEAVAAVRDCISAGITPVMITGDHPATALAIAKAAGLDTSAGVLLGSEIEELSFAALRERLRGVRVFARIAPAQKLRLVEALKANGEVVAMTGDGVNDAPALKKANIGVAMGSGTSVAKSASAMVLADDNFSTIAGAVVFPLSPPEREEIARMRTQQIVSRNRRVLLNLAAAEAVLKQGRDLLDLLAKSQTQAA